MKHMRLSIEQEAILHLLYTSIPEEPFNNWNPTTMSGFDICQNIFYPVEQMKECVDALRFVGLVEEKKYTNHFRLTSLGRRYYEEFQKARYLE